MQIGIAVKVWNGPFIIISLLLVNERAALVCVDFG